MRLGQISLMLLATTGMTVVIAATAELPCVALILLSVMTLIVVSYCHCYTTLVIFQIVMMTMVNKRNTW